MKSALAYPTVSNQEADRSGRLPPAEKINVRVEKRRRGRTARSLWRWMKRRAAIEPGIGHLKREHRMDRNRLRGKQGDRINAILSAAGMNFWKLLRGAADFLFEFSLVLAPPFVLVRQFRSQES